MALNIRTSQKGAVGPIVPGVVDESGLPVPYVVPAVTVVDQRGTPASGSPGPPPPGTVPSRASAAADTLVLAANANRQGAAITNTDENPLRLLLSTGVASATNFTVSVASGGYYEVPFGYTGQIRGIWDADGTGGALVTEFS